MKSLKNDLRHLFTVTAVLQAGSITNSLPTGDYFEDGNYQIRRAPFRKPRSVYGSDKGSSIMTAPYIKRIPKYRRPVVLDTDSTTGSTLSSDIDNCTKSVGLWEKLRSRLSSSSRNSSVIENPSSSPSLRSNKIRDKKRSFFSSFGNWCSAQAKKLKSSLRLNKIKEREIRPLSKFAETGRVIDWINESKNSSIVTDDPMKDFRSSSTISNLQTSTRKALPKNLISFSTSSEYSNDQMKDDNASQYSSNYTDFDFDAASERRRGINPALRANNVPLSPSANLPSNIPHNSGESASGNSTPEKNSNFLPKNDAKYVPKSTPGFFENKNGSSISYDGNHLKYRDIDPLAIVKSSETFKDYASSSMKSNSSVSKGRSSIISKNLVYSNVTPTHVLDGGNYSQFGNDSEKIPKPDVITKNDDILPNSSKIQPSLINDIKDIPESGVFSHTTSSNKNSGENANRPLIADKKNNIPESFFDLTDSPRHYYKNSSTTKRSVASYKVSDMTAAILQLFAHNGFLRGQLHKVGSSRQLPRLHRALASSFHKYFESPETYQMAASALSDRHLKVLPDISKNDPLSAMNTFFYCLDKEKSNQEPKMKNLLKFTFNAHVMCSNPQCVSFKDAKKWLSFEDINNESLKSDFFEKSIAMVSCKSCGNKSLKSINNPHIAHPPIFLQNIDQSNSDGQIYSTKKIHDNIYNLCGIITNQNDGIITFARDSEKKSSSWFRYSNGKRDLIDNINNQKFSHPTFLLYRSNV